VKNKSPIKDVVNSLIFLVKKLWVLLSDFRKYFILGIFLISFVEIANLAREYIFKDVIDNFIYTEKDLLLGRLLILIIILAVVYLIQSSLNFIVNIVLVNTSIKIGNYLTCLITEKNLDLSLAYHEKENTGAKLNKLQAGVDKLIYFFENMFWGFVPTIIRIVFSTIFLLYIDWRLSIAFFVIIPIFLYTTIKTNYKVDPLRKQIRQKEETVYGQIGQAIYNIKTVKAYTREEYEKKRTELLLGVIFQKFRKFFKVVFSLNFIRENLIGLGNIIMLGYGGYLTYLGEITPGDLVLLTSIGVQTYYYLYSFTRTVDHIMDAKIAINRVLNVLDKDSEVTVVEGAIKKTLLGKIEFKNVNFDYGEGKVLKNINFTIKSGEVVALVGSSGGGKTTVAKLLYRYYDVSSGVILIDDEPIEKLDMRNYRSQLGIVDQEIDIFNDTIKNNIAYGKPKASIRKIQASARIANAEEFILKLKKKYNTLVGERGVKLSGGQRQRIGIARAILVDPKILILDEATSALDAESERMIQSAIHKVIKDRTTIIIAHRLSTIKNVDRILVIDKGKIIQQGTHNQLVRKKGLYKRLVNLQLDTDIVKF